MTFLLCLGSFSLKLFTCISHVDVLTETMVDRPSYNPLYPLPACVRPCSTHEMGPYGSDSGLCQPCKPSAHIARSKTFNSGSYVYKPKDVRCRLLNRDLSLTSSHGISSKTYTRRKNIDDDDELRARNVDLYEHLMRKVEREKNQRELLIDRGETEAPDGNANQALCKPEENSSGLSGVVGSSLPDSMSDSDSDRITSSRKKVARESLV